MTVIARLYDLCPVFVLFGLHLATIHVKTMKKDILAERHDMGLLSGSPSRLAKMKIRIYAHKRKQAWLESTGAMHRKCSICGYSKCPAALDYHHRAGTVKRFAVSTWMGGHAHNDQNKKLLLKELAKCDVLCANCHRELHWNETNSP